MPNQLREDLVMPYDNLLGYRLPDVPPEDQLNVLCEILRQINKTDRYVEVSFDDKRQTIRVVHGKRSNIKM